MIMSTTYEPESVHVSDDGVIAIESQGLEAIRVTSGIIWATDASGRDMIVSAGQEVALDGLGKVVISGLRGPASFEHYALSPMQLAA